jgi:hypothetical protein
MTTLARSTICLVLAALAGCDQYERTSQGMPVNQTTQSSRILFFYVDAETGCQYLVASTDSITPRIAADGHSHMGCKGAQP